MATAATSRAASATDRRSSASQSRRQATTSTTDRRVERHTTTTHETETRTRTRSPRKQVIERRIDRKRSRDGEFIRTNGGSPHLEKSEEPPKPWSPQATIIHPTTAPLAIRVSVPPLASLTPQDLQPKSLQQLSLDQQERAVVEDLLFVFMGFEGQYVHFADTYDPLEEKDRLVGPAFRIASGLDPSLRDLTTAMLKMPTHYIAVETFLDVLSREEYGSVNHALCAAIRKLLKDYLILIAQLENQFLTDDAFTLHVLNLHVRPTSHMLLQLYNLAVELAKANSILPDDKEESAEESENELENILESLRDGGKQVGLAGKRLCKGGSTLGLITRRLTSMAGDPAARSLLTTLLKEASRPYMRMLNEWLHHGGIRDPHSEFLVKEQQSIKRERLDQDYTDEYWEKRYTIRENLVPPQLEAVKEKVLLAGKYLNVVRECGRVDVSKEVKDVPLTLDDPTFLENVNNAYAYANSSLLDLLLTIHALPDRLRSLKHYFFLDRSDFFSYFMELSTSELKKPAREVNTGKLQSLLDIVLRQPGSVAAEDPYKEDVKVIMHDALLIDWLMNIVSVTGLEQDATTGAINSYTPAAQSASAEKDGKILGFDALGFDYSVPFPLSLVVSRVTLTRYQLIFRYLLSLRHLETLLINGWTDHHKLTSWRHRSSNPRIERAKRKAWTLRTKMLIFVQQLIYYCTAEVIEPNWQSLMSRLNGGDGEAASTQDRPTTKRTVDELMQDHVDFLATCLKECMLTNSKLLRINSKILQTCTSYATYTSSFGRYLAAADPDLANKSIPAATPAPKTPSSSTAYDPSKLDRLEDLLQKFEDSFGRHLRILLDTLNYLAATETVVFLSLCARLSQAGDAGMQMGLDVSAYG